MKSCHPLVNQTTRRLLLIGRTAALAVAFTVSVPQPAHADHVRPPPVPSNIQVPAGNKAFLEGHALGTQDYICLSSGSTSTDPAFVAPGAIPWLLLQVVGAQDGPTGGHKLTATTFIQRLNTAAGVAPSTGCTLSTDVGKKALVPYTADYFFYK